ncbi:hypothetical protein GGF32_000614 [Allomyces javanicus]|nr:hypothetical protein GGF32_000614 [Allomyces javanicus]
MASSNPSAPPDALLYAPSAAGPGSAHAMTSPYCDQSPYQAYNTQYRGSGGGGSTMPAEYPTPTSATLPPTSSAQWLAVDPTSVHAPASPAHYYVAVTTAAVASPGVSLSNHASPVVGQARYLTATAPPSWSTSTTSMLPNESAMPPVALQLQYDYGASTTAGPSGVVDTVHSPAVGQWTTYAADAAPASTSAAANPSSAAPTPSGVALPAAYHDATPAMHLDAYAATSNALPSVAATFADHGPFASGSLVDSHQQHQQQAHPAFTTAVYPPVQSQGTFSTVSNAADAVVSSHAQMQHDANHQQSQPQQQYTFDYHQQQQQQQVMRHQQQQQQQQQYAYDQHHHQSAQYQTEYQQHQQPMYTSQYVMQHQQPHEYTTDPSSSTATFQYASLQRYDPVHDSTAQPQQQQRSPYVSAPASATMAPDHATAPQPQQGYWATTADGQTVLVVPSTGAHQLDAMPDPSTSSYYYASQHPHMHHYDARQDARTVTDADAPTAVAPGVTYQVAPSAEGAFDHTSPSMTLGAGPAPAAYALQYVQTKTAKELPSPTVPAPFSAPTASAPAVSQSVEPKRSGSAGAPRSGSAGKEKERATRLHINTELANAAALRSVAAASAALQPTPTTEAASTPHLALASPLVFSSQPASAVLPTDPNWAAAPDTPVTAAAPPSASDRPASATTPVFPRRRRTCDMSTDVGPAFESVQVARVKSLDGQLGYTLRVDARMDKGFFVANELYTCYRRNYTQLSACFAVQSAPSIGHPLDVPCLVEVVDPNTGAAAWKVAEQFQLGIVAHVQGENRPVDLVQMTAKRDRGPQLAPAMRPCRPGGRLLPVSGLHQLQTVAVFERIQFKAATANNGRRKHPQQCFVVKVLLFAKLAGERNVVPTGLHAAARHMPLSRGIFAAAAAAAADSADDSMDPSMSSAPHPPSPHPYLYPMTCPPGMHVVAVASSAGIVVRGRSPGHYKDHALGFPSSSSSSGNSGSSGPNAPPSSAPAIGLTDALFSPSAADMPLYSPLFMSAPLAAGGSATAPATPSTPHYPVGLGLGTVPEAASDAAPTAPAPGAWGLPMPDGMMGYAGETAPPPPTPTAAVHVPSPFMHAPPSAITSPAVGNVPPTPTAELQRTLARMHVDAAPGTGAAEEEAA